jgi:excisionase family DNA binding protein
MRLLTVCEAAERLGLKPATMRFWIWTRRIEHVKVGRAVRVREEAILDLIERGTIPAYENDRNCNGVSKKKRAVIR